MEDDVSSRTYAQSVRTFFTNKEHQRLVQDAVVRMHRIKLIASEFFVLHVHRCLDRGLTLPVVDQSWIRRLFMHASHLHAEGVAQTSDDTAHDDDDSSIDATVAQLEATRTYDRPSRSGLTQMLSAEAKLLVATYETNICVHYKSRIHRFVRWTFKPEFKLPLDDYKQLKTEMAQVAADLCRDGRQELVSPYRYHPWIAQYRSFFRLDDLLRSETLSYMLKTHPHRFLYSMRLMNRAFEGSGLKRFAIVPLTTTSRPGFVSFDVRTVGEVLRCGTTESRKLKQRAAQKKRDEERRLGTYKSPAEKRRDKQLAKEVMQAEAKQKREEQRLADARLTESELRETKKRRRQEAIDAKEAKRAKAVEKRRADADSKDSFFSSFARFRVNAARGFEFSHSFKTDGVSVRLLYERPNYVPKQPRRQGVPKRGLYAIDTLKHLSSLTVDEMQVIGIDPGMIDLIHCVDPDRILETQPIGEPPASLVYTAARRKHETCSVLYEKRMEEEKKQTPDVLAVEGEMGKYSKRSTDRDVLLSYFDARRSGSISLDAFYGDLRYRIRRWRSFQKEQRSIQKLIHRIEGMRTKETMVLAYGSAVTAISKLRPKGVAPCINMGLRRRLSKHFVVVDTPEHYTSQTCSVCHCQCGPFTELEEQRRKELKLKREQETVGCSCTSDAKRHAHKRCHEIRGLRRCQNVDCGVILHRDRNAAINIATNFRRLYSGQPLPRQATAADIKLVTALRALD